MSPVFTCPRIINFVPEGLYCLLSLERVHDLLRVGQTALKSPSECSFRFPKLRFLSAFRLVLL